MLLLICWTTSLTSRMKFSLTTQSRLRLQLLSLTPTVLVEQLIADPTPKTIRQLVDLQQRGYMYLDAVLIHIANTDLDTPVCQVVLPVQHRSVVLMSLLLYTCSFCCFSCSGDPHRIVPEMNPHSDEIGNWPYYLVVRL